MNVRDTTGDKGNVVSLLVVCDSRVLCCHQLSLLVEGYQNAKNEKSNRRSEVPSPPGTSQERLLAARISKYSSVSSLQSDYAELDSETP